MNWTDELDNRHRLYRCRVILNCADVCPKGLNPAWAIEARRRGFQAPAGGPVHRALKPRGGVQ